MLYKVPSNLRYQSGIYIITPYSNPSILDTSRVKVKIGLAKHTENDGTHRGIYTRVDSYNTSYPDSFWIYSIIVTRNPTQAVELEKYIFNKLKDYKYINKQYEPRKGGGEWFFLRKQTLRNVLNEVIIEKWNWMKGLFNYNEKVFSLDLPIEVLGNTPKRILYKSADTDTKVILPRKPRRKKKTHVIVTTSYIPKKDINALPTKSKREKVPNKKYIS